MTVLVDAVEPQGYFRELASDRVEVHPEHVAVGDVVLRLLQLVGVLGVRDALVPLALAAVEVVLRELVDRFVEERGGAHRGLADGEVENTARRHFVRDQLLEGVLDDAPGEALRGVVARGLLPVAPREAVDEPALAVDLELPQAAGAPLEYAFLLAVLVELAEGHEPGVRKLVRVLPRLLHFIEVLLREEAAVGEQGLVHRPSWLMPSWAYEMRPRRRFLPFAGRVRDIRRMTCCNTPFRSFTVSSSGMAPSRNRALSRGRIRNVLWSEPASRSGSPPSKPSRISRNKVCTLSWMYQPFRDSPPVRRTSSRSRR